MNAQPNSTFADLVVNGEDGHTFTVFDLFTDFVFPPCPVCRSEYSDIASKPRFQKAGKNRGAVLEIPMTCRTGHAWHIRLLNWRGEQTALACVAEGSK